MAENCLNSEECIPVGAHSFSFDKVESLMNESVLLKTPYPVLTLLACYLLLVLRLGHVFMADRQPYSLSTTMRVYNICQVAINSFWVLEVSRRPGMIKCFFKNRCTMTDLENCEEYFYTYYSLARVFMVLKVWDLADTVFMVLKKNDSHVTFLHLYHHVSMVVSTWICIKYTKTLHAMLPCVLNMVVHTVMYSYYFLATFPRLKKYLWWKSHLTKLQLGQFVLILMHFGYLYENNCHVSRIFAYIGTFNVTVICMMFINFYIKEYIVKRQKANECLLHETTKNPK